MDDVLFKKLTKARTKTPNILAPNTPGFEEEKKKLIVARQSLRSIAQNYIDAVAEHRHLKKARILILEEYADSVGKKLDNGEYVSVGRASKAKPIDKLLARIAGKSNKVDFIIRLSGDYLKRIDCDAPGEGQAKAMALIDHELLHCGAKLAGEFVKPDLVESYVADLGDMHIETRKNITRNCSILVRFYHVNKAGDYEFKLRRHDVEDFHGVVARHGGHDWQLARLIDILKESDGQGQFKFAS